MTVSYKEYKSLRNMGLRAVTAFGICKYGIDFLCTLVVDLYHEGDVNIIAEYGRYDNE